MIESREMDKIFVVNLAEAIIAQAAKDYRNALKGVGIRYKKAALVRQECEEFFRSDYYKLLSDVDGEMIIKMLKEEHFNQIRR